MCRLTCNAMERIRSVDAQFRGNGYLLDNSRYCISSWLLTPFKLPRNELERSYNRLHSRKRIVIESVFGFPILANKMRLSANKVPKLIVCCAAVFHNIAKHLHDEWYFVKTNENNSHSNNEEEDPENSTSR